MMTSDLPEFSTEDMTQTLPQIIWTALPDGTVDWINQAFDQYTGVSNADFAAGDWLLAVHPDDRDATIAAWDKAREREHSYRTEFRVWFEEKNCWRWHMVSAEPHRDDAGKITRWYGNAIDIQKIKETQEAYNAELRLRAIENQVLDQASKGEPIDRILKTICREISNVLPGALSTLAMVSDDGSQLRACHGVDALNDWARALGAIPVGEGYGACGTAAFRREPVYSSDIANDALWTAYRDLAAKHDLAACWSLPILDPSGRLIAGFSCYYRAPQEPDKVQIERLQRIAAAIQNAFVQVQSRDRLIESERRYRSLFDFLPIAVWEEDISDAIEMLDEVKRSGVTDLEAWLDQNPKFIDRVLEKMRVLDANDAARRLHGIQNTSPEALLSALKRNLSQKDFRQTIRDMLIASWSGVNMIKRDSVIAQPDGTKKDLQIQMLLPEEGRGRLLVTEIDVTEQRRAEERFRHVAHASSDYIFDRDFRTDTTWVSDGASWHPDLPAGPSFIPRNAWVESVHPEDAGIVDEIADAIRDGADTWEGEYRLRKRDGSFIVVREHANFIREEDGTPIRMIGNLVDLTEQRELEAQLRQSQRLDAIGQLTGGIAHDFNNLLTVILGNAEVLAEILPSDQKPTAMIQQIIHASERAAELTQHLLAFASKQSLMPDIHDAAAVIKGMRVLVERSLTPAIMLELELAEEPAYVRVDRAMFESAILNLCLNARDAMPKGGRLRIETAPVSRLVDDDPQTSQRKDYLSVTIRDTGVGIDTETLDRVFEPFFTTKPPGEGSGLGLSMVYGFVRQSGGQIRVESTPGHGTTVELLLPIHAAGTGSLPSHETATETPEFGGRILVVEDDEQVRDYTCMLVQALGFEVVAEPLATSALERLQGGDRFDLVLSDVVMPGGLNGRQLAEKIIETWPDLPVLLVSGHSEEMSSPDRRLASQISFLRKPFRKRDLVGKLAEMLSQE